MEAWPLSFRISTTPIPPYSKELNRKSPKPDSHWLMAKSPNKRTKFKRSNHFMSGQTKKPPKKW